MKHSQTQCPGRVSPAWTPVSALFPRYLRLAAFAGLGASVAFFGQPLFCAASLTLPAGGQVVSGAATFFQSGTTLTVTQTSARAATNWRSFNIGALNASGHVFLLNPNGVLFNPTAQVNVGGTVASTLRMNTEDFMAGRSQRDKWELNSSVAWRAWGGAPEADTRVKGGRPCVWVGVNYRF